MPLWLQRMIYLRDCLKPRERYRRFRRCKDGEFAFQSKSEVGRVSGDGAGGKD
jgi:hypothetical protein